MKGGVLGSGGFGGLGYRWGWGAGMIWGMASLQWIGKEAVVGHHREVPYHLLKGEAALSVGEDGGVGSGNLLVQGDNLVAL